MCPRGRASRNISALLRPLALATLLLAPPALDARADELLDYLEARGLDTLAARRLEDLARAASGDERTQHLDRLAALFARLLDESVEGDAQLALLGRADQLAESLATAGGDELRVAAARARYKAAARVAESIRAGIAGDATAAAETLSVQADTLLKTAERADKRSADLDRRLEREQGIGRDLLSQKVERERSLAGQARYIAAWSLLYRGMLARSNADLERSQKLFVAMLGGRDGALEPAEVSQDLRRDEAFASAVLGLSLVKARLAGYSESSRWLELLEAKDTHPTLREAAPGWSMVAALDARAFKAARTCFARLGARADIANWARVAAARSIEDGGSDADATLLAREALAQLAASRELDVLRALVARYGDGILGEDRSGFVPRYVQAVRLYDEAQKALADAGADQEKVVSDSVRGPSRKAAEALGEALAASDVAAYSEAALACRVMRAWSLRGSGAYREAARAFDEIAAQGVGAQAEQTLRLAIASLDDARREAASVEERSRIDGELLARIDAFLSRFPGSDFVPELLVRKVAASGTPESADIDALLAVTPDSKEWLSSRRQAAFALYRVFRGGRAPRAETAARYLAVIAELPADAETGLPASSPAMARQALEVVLATEVRDVKMAAALLDGLAVAGQKGQFDLREADEELAYRRLQLAMYTDRWDNVEPILAAFEKPEATKLWADAALRLAVRGAEAKRRASPAGAPERGAFVATILRASDAILEREGGVAAALAPKAPELATLGPIARIALDARVELLGSTSDAKQARRGLEIASALLASSPRDSTLLEGGAICAEGAGELDRAAEYLRTLVGGLPPRTKPWFEAKISQIRVLGRLDPARARAVLEQYRTLYPDLGPEPIRLRILELERALAPDGASRSPAADGATARREGKP